MGLFHPTEDVLRCLKKYEREQAQIDNRRDEIDQAIRKLQYEDDDLIERLNELKEVMELCHRALAGEPIAIWAEIHRFL